MSVEPRIPPFAMARSLLALAGLVIGGAAAVAAALALLGRGDQLGPALGGAAVALVAGVAALVPLHWADRRPATTVPMLAMAGTGLRVLATLGGALVLIFVLRLEMPAVALWTLGWYLIVMVFEIWLLIRYFKFQV